MIRTLVLAIAVAMCPATAGAQSFWSIFTELPTDFARLAQPSNLVILGSTGAGSLAIHPKDDEIAENAAPGSFFTAGDVMGEGWVHAVVGLGIYTTGRLSHKEKIGGLGVDLLQGQIVSGLITDGLKLATDRTRPDGGSHSFPSGHTSTAFATAAVLQSHFGWKVGIPAYVLAGYVATSRVANAHHFASDVVFGAGIGMAAGRATTFKLWGQQASVTPSVSRRAASLNVVIGAAK